MEENILLSTILAIQSKRDPEVRLGIIPADYTPGSPVTVCFDGEDAASTKSYPIMDGYYPVPLDRVMLKKSGSTWVIMGKVGASPVAAVPTGVIVMWSGASTAIPTGWALCDGTNGTPDLRGRFIVGAGGSYAVGANGGEASHTLTEAEMPAHSHGGSVDTASGHTHSVTVDSGGGHGHTITVNNTNSAHGHQIYLYDPGKAAAGSDITIYWPYMFKTGTTSVTASDGGTHTHTASAASASGHIHSASTASGGSHGHGFTSNSKGSGTAHENRPPYYALCFIQKL